MNSALANRFSFPRFASLSILAPLGVCAYVFGMAVPFKWDIPLMVLAVTGGLAFLVQRGDSATHAAPLLFPVLVFLIATGVSLLASEDIGRSLRLSTPLLPALLVFFLIADRFQGARHTRVLYLTFSAAGLSLALAVLWTAWQKAWVVPHGWQSWMSEVGSPIFVVANDITFLAVIAPLSLVLFYSESQPSVRVLAALSILASAAAGCVIQSRVAIITLVATITVVAALLRPRLAVASGAIVLALVLLVDGLLGFPLVAKFGQVGDGRIPIWLEAWAMFVANPLLGHGPHTFVYTSPDAITVTWAHNLYLETLAEQGLVGLAALGLLLVSGIRTAWKVQRSASHESRILAVGALGGLVGFCLAGLFELSFLRQWVMIVLFSLLGVIAQLESTNRR